MAQSRYWKEFHLLRYHISYLEMLVARSDKIDRSISSVIAIASSSSIAAWVLWKDWSLVWGGVIASSQVLSAISPYLPYRERYKCYSSMLHDLEGLAIYTESLWFEISSGTKNEGEINEARMQIKKKKTEIIKKWLPAGVIPLDVNLAAYAEDEVAKYFSNFYPVEE